MHVQGVRIVVAVLACAAFAAPERASAQTPCEEQVSDVPSSGDGVPGAIATRVDRAVRSAGALVRFQRRNDATAKLDRVIALIDGASGERLKPPVRAELTKSLHALRDCVATADAPGLATITIRAVIPGEAPNSETAVSGEAFVDVEGVRIGRTGSDGTLQAKVPSGDIHITVTEYPSSWGEAEATLSPGATQTVSVRMDDSKEPSEESDLVLEEAPDDILPSHPASFTLKFVQDDAPVAIDRVESIELWDASGSIKETFEKLFRVRNGSILATDAASVYRRIEKHRAIARPLSLFVYAIDTEGRNHYGTASFQIGLWKLSAVLAPPPSNPSLPVSNIPVRVAVVNSDIAMTRVSDAGGRFEFDALPDATITFDAHTVAGGIHYYADAAVTMCAERLVTVFLLNVKDLQAGAPALVIDPSSPSCPPVPRK